MNVNMNFLAHGAETFLKIFATTSFNVWRHFSTHYILQCLAPTPCEVWAARTSAPPRPLPFRDGASDPRTTPDRRRRSSINVFQGPNRGDPRREAVPSEAPVHLQLSHPNLCRAASRIAVESGFVSQLTIGQTSSSNIVLDVPK